MNRIVSTIAGLALAGGLGLGAAACSTASITTPAPAVTKTVTPKPAPADDYWIADGTSSAADGPYLYLLQWGPPSSTGAVSGTLAGYSLTAPNPGCTPCISQLGGQLETTSTPLTITGSSNLVISGALGVEQSDIVVVTATISGDTLTLYDPNDELVAPTTIIFKPGTPAEFSADLAQITAEAPNGQAGF